LTDKLASSGVGASLLKLLLHCHGLAKH
jgi:hypothetical protein